ncbi:MAG: ABC transporter ATP-binding protein/permease, partial [Malacoplasma sp.]|nr:ABC transporter ATP-binding protein/permease [Malacoplasma sp.]
VLITYAVQEIQSKNMDKFYMFMGIYLGIFFISVIFAYFKNILIEIYLQKLNTKLRNIFVSNLYGKNFEFIKNNNSAIVHNWINNDILNIYKKATLAFFDIVNFTLTLIFSFVGLIILFWGIALIVFALAIILLFVPLIFNKKLAALGQKFGMDNQKYFSRIYKNTIGIRNLFFLNRLDIIIDNIKNDSKDFKNNKINFLLNQYKIIWILMLLSILGQILGIIFSAIFCVVYWPNSTSTVMNPASLFSVTFLVGNVFGSFQQLFGTFTGFFAGKALINKNILPEQDYGYIFNESLEDFKYWELKDLSLTYENRKIFENINLKFEKNKKYLICGDSGSGKSSIIKIILGMNQDFKGKVFWNKHDLKTINHKLINGSSSYVINEGHLFESSVIENITLFDSKVDNQKLKNALDLSKVDFIDDLSKEIHKSKFSTGQLQRLNIARHLYENKNIIIFDEALSNLDSKNASEIENSLLKNKDLTFINVTHHINKENLKYYDQVLKIQKGSIENVKVH